MDEQIQMDQPDEDLFNPNKATSSYKKPTDKFTFLQVTFEDEPMSTEQEYLFATKKDINSLRSMMRAIIAGMDLSKFQSTRRDSEEAL